MDEPVFHAYHLALASELTTLELEDDLPEGDLISVLRELSKRLADLADYYEAEGTAELFETTDLDIEDYPQDGEA